MTSQFISSPLNNALTLQGQNTGAKELYGATQSILRGTHQSMGVASNLLGVVGGLGSNYGLTRSAFELLVLEYGNKDQALQKFISIASQSGQLGSAISVLFNGKASLQSIGKDLKASVTNIQSAFNSIENVNVNSIDDLRGIIVNAESIVNTIGSTAQDLDNTVTTLLTDVSNITLEGTVNGLLESAKTYVDSALSGVIDTGNALVNSALSVGSLFGFGPSESAKLAYEDPTAVSILIGTGCYSLPKALELNAGNVNVTQQKPSIELDSTDFKDVAEGSTPPVKGVYGGPNFGGAEAIVKPATPDMSQYEGGSKREINLKPPKGFGGNEATASKNIQLILQACEKFKVVSKEQKAAILGVIGGECKWSPVAEGSYYKTEAGLNSTFGIFKKNPSLAPQYIKISDKVKFFECAYGCSSTKGLEIGNKQPGDGGKYYGRGFIQLTGKNNYRLLSKLSGYDLLNDPDILINDPQKSAEIAVLFALENTKGVTPTAHPGYMETLLKRVGGKQDSWPKKRQYYEYFYGLPMPEYFGYTEKIAGPALPPNSYDGAMLGNEAGKSNNKGFKDPNNKYPLKRTINEQELPKLSRGDPGDSIHQLKNSKRRLGIPLPNGEFYDQPESPYSPVYPYNQVKETESGHIQEFDDTPGNERIHTYHRTGTFTEIDANGNVVTKIVGDNYTIIDNNGNISIDGNANVSVMGNINIYCASNANIDVAGSAEMKIGGNFAVGVAGDMDVAVQGDYSVWANGNFNLQAKNKGHILAGDNLYVSASNQLHLFSYNATYMESKTSMDFKSTTDMKFRSDAKIHTKSKSDTLITSTGSTSIKPAGSLFLNPTGAAHVKAGGAVNVDGSTVNLNSGSSSGGTGASDADGAVKALIHGMIPPAPGAVNRVVRPYDGDNSVSSNTTPLYMGNYTNELEDSEIADSGAGKIYRQERAANNGKPDTAEVDSSSGSTGPTTAVKPSKAAEIMTSKRFTSDYRISKHFTIGMMCRKEQLQPQRGLTVQQIVSNMAALSENCLEKILPVLPNGITGYGSTSKHWTIWDGFRSATRVGSNGSATSNHHLGSAVDLHIQNQNTQVSYNTIIEIQKLIPFYELYLEYDKGPWIHISFMQSGITYPDPSRAKRWGTWFNYNFTNPNSWILRK